MLEFKKALVGVAALWHDIGKCNQYFQRKLAGEVPISDPVRHEWVSSAIVHSYAENVIDWISGRFYIPDNIVHKDSVETDDELLSVVLWLMNSHHKKAVVDDVFSRTVQPTLKDVLMQIKAGQAWVNDNWEVDECYKLDSSFLSDEYVTLLDHYRGQLNNHKSVWFGLEEDQKIHVLQECRVALMLGDSNYSSQYDHEESTLYANLDSEGNYKQSLTQHLLGVTKHAVNSVEDLNTQKIHKASHIPFLDNESKSVYSWQNSVKNLPENFDNLFCINIASTGRGKTLANLKLLQKFGSLRCSVALGMVSLTKQTTSQFYNVAGINTNDMAMVVGFKQQNKPLGSESLDQDELDLWYTGEMSTLQNIFPNNNIGVKNTKVLNAPILVSTVDHLVKAAGVRKGNKHMLPFVRCMQSDLVLDEIDDYGVEDMKILARLACLTASYGNKVIISSATITPAISEVFYEAYNRGWQVFCKNSGLIDETVNVVWIDEYNLKHEKVDEDFNHHNKSFIDKRLECLVSQSLKHKAEVVDGENLLSTIEDSITKLHDGNCINGISYGVVRVTTIQDCVKVTKHLQDWDTDLNIKLICYHSRFLQGTKDQMEKFLTDNLNRKDPDKFYQGTPTVYIVVATPVVEVGRDFDFDWAVIEPSSERSIVQTSGRVLRHRSLVPDISNIHILPFPFKYLRNDKICYDTAGYESRGFKLRSKKMVDIYDKTSIVNSVNRLKGETKNWKKSLVNLEHKVLTDSLTCVESDNGVFTKGWSLTANPHVFCQWRRGVEQVTYVMEGGYWRRKDKIVETKPVKWRIWERWGSEDGEISFPEYLQNKTVCYNSFYGGYVEED